MASDIHRVVHDPEEQQGIVDTIAALMLDIDQRKVERKSMCAVVRQISTNIVVLDREIDDRQRRVLALEKLFPCLPR